MKAYKCKDSEERLKVIGILQSMGVDVSTGCKNGATYLPSHLCLFLNTENNRIYLSKPYSLPTDTYIVDLNEFLAQFRTKGYKCESLEEQQHIIKLLKDKDIPVYSETGNDPDYPILALDFDLEISGNTIMYSRELTTRAEFLKQFGIEETSKNQPEYINVSEFGGYEAGIDLIRGTIELTPKEQFVKPPKPTIQWN